MNVWLTILAAGAITYLTRLSFILLFEKLAISDWLRRALRYVPVTVLTAIFLPEMLFKNGSVDITLANPRFFAGIIGILVAWRTRSVLLTLLAGMGALWLLQWLIR